MKTKIYNTIAKVLGLFIAAFIIILILITRLSISFIVACLVFRGEYGYSSKLLNWFNDNDGSGGIDLGLFKK